MPDRFPARYAVAGLQSALLTLGHDPGRVDGLTGPKLAAALDAYRATLPGAPAVPPTEPDVEPWPDDSEASMNAFYGQRGSGEKMTVMLLPKPLRLYSPDGPEVKSLYVNKRIAKPLYAALDEVSELPSHIIAKHELDVTGGVYNNRKTTSGSGWSTHSWGAAIDLSPRQNGYGIEPTLPQTVVDIFAKHGAEWGGDWSTPDGMHFQWARS